MTREEAKQSEGKRAIFTHNPQFSSVSSYYEVTILEVSPSNERVKLEYENGLKRWDRIDELHLVEVLN